jgi:hypothetical protein
MSVMACGGSTVSPVGSTEADAATDTRPATVDTGAPKPAIDAGAPDTGVTPDAASEAAVDAAPDVDNGAPSTTYPAPHPPLPQLTNQAGGNTLASPKVFLIFYPGYPYEQQMIALAQKFGASTQWAGSTQEYNVGALAYAGSIELTGETAPASINDQQITAYLNAKIASNAFGSQDTNTIYTIFYPEATTITLQGGGPTGNSTSCSSFGGYHDDMAVTINPTAPDAGTADDGGADGGTDAAADVSLGPVVVKNFAYAVLPTCATFGNLNGVDGVTGATSHEWVEAVTDPFPSTNNGSDSAFSSVDNDHIAWMLLGGGGEAGDLCVQEANAFYVPTDLGSTVQRTWSNQLAKASHDPCSLNLPGTVYFNAAPVLNDTVSFSSQFIGGSVTTKGITIPVGQSKTIEVDLFSDAATGGPWTVDTFDLLSAFTQSAPTLNFAWDRTSGVNGEKLHLTITTVTSSSDLGGAHPFVITSSLGNTQNTWAGIVMQ